MFLKSSWKVRQLPVIILFAGIIKNEDRKAVLAFLGPIVAN